MARLRMGGSSMSEVPGATGGNAEGQPLIAGRYRLLDRLGEGGMGTVWRARDEVLHREVAVKEVRAPAGLPAPDVERMYARLEREAWAAARISNRGVVIVYDVAMQDHRPWIVMELIRGLSLADVLDAEGPMSPQRAAHIGADILNALRAAHEAGVLHRDVKPGNVLLSNDGRVVLTDFGIAMVEGSSALTITGEVIGSPEFLAPERALGRTPGPESDLWSLGVLLYAAVEGYSPFRQDTPLSTLRAVVDEELPPPRRAGALAPVIRGLLRKDPAERLSAADAERDLRIVGAGGQPTTGSQIPYMPTVAAPSPTPRPSPLREPTTPVASVPHASSAATTAAYPSAERPRRAVIVLVAGIAAIALALGGLAYALINRDNDKDKDGATQGAGGTSQGSTSAPDDKTDEPASPSTSDEPTDDGNPTTGGKTTDPPTDHSVTVTLERTNEDYTGTCAPAEGDLPHFTATFTVGSVPVSVEYRWVAAPGETTDPGWKVLDFAGEKTQQVNHIEGGYVQGAAYDGSLYVEVRKPVTAKSDTVTYKVTCEDVPPTDGGGGTYTPNTQASGLLTQRR